VRPLAVVSPAGPPGVLAALARALDADGPSIIVSERPPAELPPFVEQRVALVVETSGSTGTPKRVALSAGALLASAASSDSALGGPGQWLLALPVHYIAGINVLVRSLAAGSSPVILAPGHFSPVAFAAAAQSMDAALRYTSLVPAQLASVVEAAGEDLDILEQVRRFDRILVGGQATPPSLVARSIELGLNITRTYGSSETSGGCVYDGVPLANVRARIVDGEIELGGPTLAEGYVDDLARTESTFHDSDGVRWYRTGDTGTIVDGVVTVTGRTDGLIISGGIKVSLDEVERFVRTLPGLIDAVAVRATSERWGEVPVIVSTGTMPLEALRAAVADNLGAAAAPSALITVDELPLLSSGKPDRLALTNLAASKAALP
jgi:O-succinylbenzoic acid--CoA ligase